MGILQLQDVPWWLRRTAIRLGLWGLLGLVFLLASLIFYVTKVAHLQQLTQAAYTEYELRQARAISTVKQVPNMQKNNILEIKKFYQTLPSAPELPKLLAQINQLANQHKLVLNSGDYQLRRAHQSANILQQSLVHYQIVLPVNGGYLQVRSFIADALHDMPALALDSVEIQRENTLSSKVETKLVFVLFVKEAVS